MAQIFEAGSVRVSVAWTIATLFEERAVTAGLFDGPHPFPRTDRVECGVARIYSAQTDGPIYPEPLTSVVS